MLHLPLKHLPSAAPSTVLLDPAETLVWREGDRFPAGVGLTLLYFGGKAQHGHGRGFVTEEDHHSTTQKHLQRYGL